MPRTGFRRVPLALFLCALLVAPFATADVLLDEETTVDLSAQAVPLIEKIEGEVRFLNLSDLNDPMHTPIPADAYLIGPGSRLTIAMGGVAYRCTANFIWRDNVTSKLYLGAAGHCFVPPDKVATHGPGANYDPNLTAVGVCVSFCSPLAQLSGGGTTVENVLLGPVVYARQAQSGVQLGNDFGLVEIPPQYYSKIRTTMPVWLGPTEPGYVTNRGLICHYGHGLGVGATWPTMGRIGVGLSHANVSGVWTALLAAEPGDSGSAVITCRQDEGGVHGVGAAGILTHGLGVVAPVTLLLTYGTTIAKAKQMATQRGLDVDVVYTYP